MIRKVLEPKSPQLLANLTLRRVAMLIQRFEVLEDARQSLPSNAQRVQIHERSHRETSRRVASLDIRLGPQEPMIDVVEAYRNEMKLQSIFEINRTFGEALCLDKQA